MNKKGQDIKIVIAIICSLLILIFFVGVIYPKYIKGAGSTDEYLTNADFDGDGQSDRSDDCPCGPDNKPQETNSALYCLAGYTKEQCACANSFANSVLQKEMKNKKTENLFIWNDASGKCLYKKDSCAYLVEAHNSDIENTAQLNACKTIPGE